MVTCDCGKVCTSAFNLRRHQGTATHKLNVECGEPVLRKEGMYTCHPCHYSTERIAHFRKHLHSEKHQSAKLVLPPHSSAEVQPVLLMEVVTALLKSQENQSNQQSEIMNRFASRILDYEAHQPVPKNVSGNTTTNININSHNKFNLNVFLNEECRNAVNLSDFIQELQVNMEDLQHLCEVGYMQGMSKILTKAMAEKETTQRPIHCSDVKRETMYVRKNDIWEKDADKEECNKLINSIVSKNYKTMSKWCEEHPEYKITDSPDYEVWYNTTRQICNNDPRAMKKLMQHLAVITHIEKDS